MKNKHASATFEEQLARLEEIVQVLDAGTVPLDEMLTLYAEGMELTKRCTTALNEAEHKVTILQQQSQQA
jgi:exodeoxyribonuclease VII small subunit